MAGARVNQLRRLLVARRGSHYTIDSLAGVTACSAGGSISTAASPALQLRTFSWCRVTWSGVLAPQTCTQPKMMLWRPLIALSRIIARAVCGTEDRLLYKLKEMRAYSSLARYWSPMHRGRDTSGGCHWSLTMATICAQVGNDVFCMDYKAPMTAFHAFAIALTSFNNKFSI
eukprot:scaffold2926_cov399-Prasinococcus_capsulatus_cf.AAC.10